MGIFAEWQPRYAEVAVPSFPVLGKTPAINGYLKVGLKGSHALATKFTEADAFGIPLARAGITVLDVDTPDERVLADAMSKHGPSPFIVRSGSGNWQAWYRNGGEGRRIRPDPSVPVDILGAGYVVAPPSKAAKGAYQIIQGSLDNLPDLPPIASQGCAKSRTYTLHPSPPALPALERGCRPLAGVREGQRNDRLWEFLMLQARHCDHFDDLMDVARTAAEAFDVMTFSEAEVEKTARSAWKYESEGHNWLGLGARPLPASQPIGLISSSPDAFILWTLLNHNHAGKTSFIVANAMAKTMPPKSWKRERFAAARKVLLDKGHIHELRSASTWKGAALYGWGPSNGE